MRQSSVVALRVAAAVFAGGILPACGGAGGGDPSGSVIARASLFSLTADVQPPTLTVSVAQNLLRPSNGKMIDVGLSVAATDDSGQAPQVTIRVFSNEPDGELGKQGLPVYDAEPGNLLRLTQLPLLLRAERSSKPPGRVYLIVVRARDAAGNYSTAGATVAVPNGGSPSATQAVQALAAQALASLTANGSPYAPIPVGKFFNTPPIAVDDGFVTTGPLQVPAPGVLANDLDVDLDPISALATSRPAHGVAILQSNGALSYVPDPGFSGTDSFTYVVSDGWTSSPPAVVSISVASPIQDTVTLLGSSANPSPFGQPVTFTATVQVVPSPVTVPTGSVTFLDVSAGVLLGTVLLNGAGVAELTIGSLRPGMHAIVADYAGGGGFGASSASLGQLVQAFTQMNYSYTPSPSVFGQTVFLTAIVSTVPPSPVIPTGDVRFADATFGTFSQTVPLLGGVATLQVSDLPVGTLALEATYPGGPGFSPISVAGLHQVNPAPTLTAVRTSADPVAAGAPVILTASVTAPLSSFPPTGTVVFKDLTNSVILGSAALDGTGRASLTISFLSAGVRAVEAAFVDSANFSPSSGLVSQTVQ